jgi:hypothetical protein
MKPKMFSSTNAERDGLIEQIGQDGVQKLLSDAFAPYREASL